MPAGVTVRQADPRRERDAILGVLRDSLPEAAAEARFEWAYLDNPAGVAKVWLAETPDDGVIGTSAALPRRFRVRGETLEGLVYSDFAVDAGHRTLGPALALLRATLKPIDDGDYAFALDHPSESMLAVYRRMGAKELGRQTRYVRLLKASGIARRRWGSGVKSSTLGSVGDLVIGLSDRYRRMPAGITVSAGEPAFDESHAMTGNAQAQRFAVCGERSADYLGWRYRAGGRFEYQLVTIDPGDRQFAFGVLAEDGDGATIIVEFVCPEDQDVERALMLALVETARQRGGEALQASATNGGAWARVLERRGFSPREESTGAVVYCARNDGRQDTLNDIGNWWITDGDRDG